MLQLGLLLSLVLLQCGPVIDADGSLETSTDSWPIPCTIVGQSPDKTNSCNVSHPEIFIAEHQAFIQSPRVRMHKTASQRKVDTTPGDVGTNTTISPPSSTAITTAPISSASSTTYVIKTDATTTNAMASDYKLGDFNSNECPAGWERIVAEDICKAGAFALGVDYQGKYDDYVPKGCYYYTAVGQWQGAWSSRADPGTPESHSQLICKRIRGEANIPGPQASTTTTTNSMASDYKLGDFNSNECPAGWKRIMGEDICKAGAFALGFEYQGNYDDHMPKGCYYYTATGQWQGAWSGGGDPGTPQSHSKLICKKADGESDAPGIQSSTSSTNYKEEDGTNTTATSTSTITSTTTTIITDSPGSQPSTTTFYNNHYNPISDSPGPRPSTTTTNYQGEDGTITTATSTSTITSTTYNITTDSPGSQRSTTTTTTTTVTTTSTTTTITSDSPDPQPSTTTTTTTATN